MKEYMEGSCQYKLALLWTSPDREVALKMVFMYANNSKRHEWWDAVRLIIWGPSAELLAKDIELQAYVKNMIKSDIEVAACKACSDMYGVSDILSGMGIEVLYMGEPLTNMLKSDWKVITI